MPVLDQMDRMAAIDPKSMRHLLQSFPAQVEGAAQMARTLSLPPPPRITCVVIGGMGGSAIGGDVIGAVTSAFLSIPLFVCRDYRLPGFIDASTLVFASSYSGNTEETLSAYEQARTAGAFIICLTSGGKLASEARRHGHPVIQLPAGLPPRAALGYSAVMLLGALSMLGLIPDMTEPLRETVELLNQLVARYGPETDETRNQAKRMARSLHGRLIAVYASSAVLNPVAVRWRGQIEENAKNLAFHHLMPEMNHNELVGWEFPAQLLQQIAVVLLRDRGDHPQVQRRFDLTREILARKTAIVHEVWSEGESLLARIFSAICLGDFVSLYLAFLNAVDPTPVPVIETLKQKLGA
ncbi:MAG: bifunctional phosphoglucose/phosphomannose isomerase [Acidobacteriia bacterium]|nr:bifunctional phosphoglucose/phosphomannose isomerase [Terriglobia bacterium]